MIDPAFRRVDPAGFRPLCDASSGPAEAGPSVRARTTGHGDGVAHQFQRRALAVGQTIVVRHAHQPRRLAPGQPPHARPAAVAHDHILARRAAGRGAQTAGQAVEPDLQPLDLAPVLGPARGDRRRRPCADPRRRRPRSGRGAAGRRGPGRPRRRPARRRPRPAPAGRRGRGCDGAATGRLHQAQAVAHGLRQAGMGGDQAGVSGRARTGRTPRGAPSGPTPRTATTNRRGRDWGSQWAASISSAPTDSRPRTMAAQTAAKSRPVSVFGAGGQQADDVFQHDDAGRAVLRPPGPASAARSPRRRPIARPPARRARRPG
jgi:hypothetical protein